MSGPLIVGAGPAGCAAAIVLARAGAAPLLIDRDAAVRDPLCGGFLSWRTVESLHALGIDPAALGAHRVERVALFAGDRHAQAALPAPAFGLSRHALDTAMRAAALAQRARLEIDTVRSIEGTRAIGRLGQREGDGLFLATGKHDLHALSRPRRARDPALGLRLRLPPSPLRVRLLAGRIELHLFAGGYAGIVLQEDGSANVCLAIRKSRLTSCGGDPAALLGELVAQHPHLAQRLGDDWPGAPRDSIGAVPYGWIARDTVPGLFRLGDQAAVIPSLAGEGIAIALASAQAAAAAWLLGGAAAAPGFQRRFAARATAPVLLARGVRAMAEHPLSARLAISVAAGIPATIRALAAATRLAAPPRVGPGVQSRALAPPRAPF